MNLSTIILIIILAIIILALLISTGAISYQVGKKTGLSITSGEIIRPVNTYLFYKAPPMVQEDLMRSLRVTSVRGITVPASFDAREKWPGAIGGPLEQGECGSCWAFACAQALSDRFRIAEPDNEELREEIPYNPFIFPREKYTVINTLSPYELISCDICKLTNTILPLTTQHLAASNQECEKGCEGGFISHVYQYVAEYGITSMGCYPPTCNPSGVPGHNCDCRLITKEGGTCRVYKPRFVYALYEEETLSKEQMKQIIMEDVYTYGPVTTGFSLYESFYNFFKNNPTGIYGDKDHPEGDPFAGGHAINIIGWDTDPETGIFYWIVRNSWGQNWGAGGFFKIQYDFGDLLKPVWMGARV